VYCYIGDPNGLQPQEIIRDLKERNVQYFFGRINEFTDLMVRKFNELAGPPASYIQNTNMTGGNMMEVVTKTVTIAFSESISSSARTDDGRAAKKEVFIDKSLPIWSTIQPEEVMRFAMIMPSSINELINNLLESEEDKCINDFPDIERIKIKCGKFPFAKGEMRAAYHGLQILSSGLEQQSIILKESLYSNPIQLTKPKYEAFLSCHRVAKFLCFEFNRLKPIDCPIINFCDGCILHLMTRKGQPYMILESAIIDKFEKYNNNSGYCATNPTTEGTNHDAIQAFSHWSFCISKERLMIVDCQGGYNVKTNSFLLTDPAVHFVDVSHFGGTNMGKAGMKKFFESHHCNHYCNTLKLTRPI
jgi:hypothetical protein